MSLDLWAAVDRVFTDGSECSECVYLKRWRGAFDEPPSAECQLLEGQVRGGKATDCPGIKDDDHEWHATDGWF